MRKFYSFVIFIFVASSLMIGNLIIKSTGDAKSYEELAGGSITLVIDTTGHFLPGFELANGDSWVTGATQDPLFRWLSGDVLSPGLVKSWEWRAGNTQLHMTLREDIHWYDGTPITTQDLEYTLAAWMASETTRVYAALKDERFGKLEILGAKEAVFSFNQAYPEFINSLRTGLLAKHIYGDELKLRPEEVTRSRYLNSPPIEATSGPFYLAEGSVKGNISLKRNPNWHGALESREFPLHFTGWPASALLEEIKLVEVAEAKERVELFKEGELDMLFSAADAQTALLEEARVGKYSYSIYFDGSYHAILLNHRNAILSKGVVRKAMRMALDFESLVSTVAPHSRKAFLPIDPRTAVFERLQSAIDDLPFDPEKSRELLASAGYGDGATLTLEVSNGVSDEFTDKLKALWKAIGLDLKVEKLDWGALLNRVNRGDYDMAYFRLQTFEYPEIAPWTVESKSDLKTGWEIGYINPQIFKLVRKSLEEESWDDRFIYYLGAFKVWTADLPIIVLSYNQKIVFWNNRLQGPAPGKGELYENLAEWYISK